MGPKNRNPKDSETAADLDNQQAATETATAGTEVPTDVSVPVETGTTAAGTEGNEKKAAKPAIPEHLKKGNRICASCLQTEASFLEKNPRYSLCQGVDVLCYRRGDRVLYGVTLEDVNAKYPDKVGKNDEQGRPLISEVGGVGIKPGILVRGAISYKRKAVDTAADAAATTSTPAQAGEAAGAAGTTSAG